mgnify:CR=1 FL=1
MHQIASLENWILGCHVTKVTLTSTTTNTISAVFSSEAPVQLYIEKKTDKICNIISLNS